MTDNTACDLSPNRGKRLMIDVDGESWLRIPIWTELFDRNDILVDKALGYVIPTLSRASARECPLANGWYLVVAEKIVAICQGRSFFLWELSPGPPARFLCRFVRRSRSGVGLGTPWTMQLAIDEAGLARIIAAAAASVVGKVLGRRGWFYRVAGHQVNAIDGPADYNAYPSNVSAKLPPENPAGVARELASGIRSKLPGELVAGFGGVAVIDANDLGCEVLGQDSDRPDRFFRRLFRDNPLDQGRTQTPLALVVRLTENERDDRPPSPMVDTVRPTAASAGP